MNSSFRIKLSLLVFIGLTLPKSHAEIGTIQIHSYAGITLTNEAGTKVRIDYTEALSEEGANWTEMETLTLPESPHLSIDKDSPFHPHRFYRVVQLDPGTAASADGTLNLAIEGGSPVALTLGSDGSFTSPLGSGTYTLSLSGTVSGELTLNFTTPAGQSPGKLTLTFSVGLTGEGTITGTLVINAQSKQVTG